MINRIFKSILVLSICIGISLPTNAAVSVSDGSAFVTKAEFAADLNNLSNRMAQLENSLDAKIDSLVSSYLTRNGIWNGAKQNINLRINEFTPATVTLSSNQAVVNKKLVSGTYITEINKSGMIVFSYSYKNKSGNNTNSTRWGYYGKMRDNSTWTLDNGFNLILYIYEKNGSISETKYSIVLFGALAACLYAANTTGEYALVYTLPSNSVSGNISFFVSKGNSVEYDITELAHFYYTSTINVFTGEDSVLQFTLNDNAYVY